MDFVKRNTDCIAQRGTSMMRCKSRENAAQNVFFICQKDISGVLPAHIGEQPMVDTASRRPMIGIQPGWPANGRIGSVPAGTARTCAKP
jgi:hypothetical protein